MDNDKSLVWRIYQELSRKQGHTAQAKGNHNSAVVANNWLCGMLCDIAMVGKVNSAWYCGRRYYSYGKDKDIQTGGTEPSIAQRIQLA